MVRSLSASTKNYGFKPLASDEEKPQKKDYGFKPDQKHSNKKEGEDESFWKSAFRYVSQIPIGLAEGSTYGILTNLSNLMAQGDILDPEEIERIKGISEREGIPFNEEAYMKAAQEALGSFPTPSNIARMTEQATGLPLEAKTKGQKALKLASTAGKITPGNIAQKTAAATTAPTVSLGLQEAGVPEQLAELGGLITSPVGAKIAPSSTLTKPSGLPKLGFEKLKKPRLVSGEKMGAIETRLETEFKKIGNEIISKAPIEETRKTLTENPAFKGEVQKQFKRVEELANEIPGELNTKVVKKEIGKILEKNKGIGLTRGEYETDYEKFMNQFIKDIPEGEKKATDLVKQYRNNNKELGEIYDPSRSRVYNRAKKDALLDYNRAIAEVLKEEYGGAAFSNLFFETNDKWKNILDAESIDKFMNDIFTGKINYPKAKKFLENENTSRPFKRALGEENFSNFNQLVQDLVKSERPYQMLKVARSKGYKDLADTAMAYVLSPKAAALKFTHGKATGGWKYLRNLMLDKPSTTLVWKKGIDDLKKGNFDAATKSFKILDDEIKKESNYRQESKTSKTQR